MGRPPRLAGPRPGVVRWIEGGTARQRTSVACARIDRQVCLPARCRPHARRHEYITLLPPAPMSTPDTAHPSPARRLLDRLEAIACSLAARDDALALLALGSVGLETDRLDDWSDLDFFVLVRTGAKGRYIADLDWLAQAHPLAWHFRNTADGHKALMADGVYCEFAVFEPHELPAIPYAPGRFVWRRDELAESLAAPARRLPAPADREWLAGEALSNLIVGLQRHARGERLAAMRLVQVHALDRVLELLEVPAIGSDNAVPAVWRRDPFNVDRRVEGRLASAHPTSLLPLWAGGYDGTVAAALALLAVLRDHAAVPQAVADHIESLAARQAGR